MQNVKFISRVNSPFHRTISFIRHKFTKQFINNVWTFAPVYLVELIIIICPRNELVPKISRILFIRLYFLDTFSDNTSPLNPAIWEFVLLWLLLSRKKLLDPQEK